MISLEKILAVLKNIVVVVHFEMTNVGTWHLEGKGMSANQLAVPSSQQLYVLKV